MNKEEKAIYDKKYRLANPHIKKEYNEKNKEKIQVYRKQQREDNLKSWEKVIGEVFNCQICNKEIYFNRKDRGKSVHFDHTTEENINIRPNNFLSDKKATIENILMWKSFKFGELCKRCNSELPTKNRKQFILNLCNYVFGFIPKELERITNV